jgi:hypothetical protein
MKAKGGARGWGGVGVRRHKVSDALCTAGLVAIPSIFVCAALAALGQHSHVVWLCAAGRVGMVVALVTVCVAVVGMLVID